ncbi:sensor histidine kinase [Mucilaginibacter hurinus]|uniref:histidine kinase n=1 Tax=Mucilaginibacter hurinus TaxID=2201324 RepID=A0A367GSG9_9SPHI|nr:HAMP domain-containing sensor histidine kinase [Mucilaginibacter hurinus]RCH56382.1 sensor histidine kinase [Mucilaginibacter hurinus]
MSTKIQPLIDKLIGKPAAFGMEARVFHAISVITLTGLFFNVFVNYLLNNPLLSRLMLAGFLMISVCYYISRFKGQLNISIVIFNLLSNVLLVGNFCYHSGINGPTLLIFLLSSFINISVAPKKQYIYWIALNLLIVVSLLAYQYNDAANIVYSYRDNLSRYVNHGYSYVAAAVILAVITTYIRNSYHDGKSQVEQKARELKHANITKNKLFSILAHDLRSPLSSIQNYLEILAEYRLDEAERKTLNNDLLKATHNTQQMLSNLLMWTKSQMEGVNANLAVVNLRDVLNTTLQVKKSSADEKGIQLTNNLKNNALVIADPDMLQLTVRNLINNSIKFTHPGGEIEISSNTSSEGECRIIIKDTGIGIPYAIQQEIFSLKVGSTFGTHNEKGVGLGLILCKEFTEMQNGKIWFESAPGWGTTFYLSLKTFRDNTTFKTELQIANNN